LGKKQPFSLKKRSRWGWVKRPFIFLWRLFGKLFQLLARAWSGFRWLTRSLWFRLMGAFAVVIILMLFIVMGVINNITTRAFSQYISQRNEYIRTVLPTLVSPDIMANTNMEIRDGQLIIRQPDPEIPERPERSESSELPALDTTVEDSLLIAPPSEEIVVDIPLLDLLAPTSPEALGFSFLADVQQAVGTAVIIAGIVSLILGTIIFYQITRPLSHMRRASQALTAGETNVQVPVRSQDELGKVAEAFNQMATKISQQEQLRQQMVADVAHELRTPLTVMKANLEGMLDGLLEPTPAELGELHEEVQRLSRLIDDLRLLSLADSGQLTLVLEEVDVRQVMARVVALLLPLADEHEVTLVDDAPERPLIITADTDRIQQALTNLVANGVRHTPKGGRVRVTAVHEKQTIHLSVIDSGPGIPPDDLAYVFNRFWRSDKSRSRHSGGSGLGLAIVKQIAELHHGYVTAVSPNNTGAIFTISLPLKQL
jgi:signal transduction histidine kinase